MEASRVQDVSFGKPLCAGEYVARRRRPVRAEDRRYAERNDGYRLSRHADDLGKIVGSTLGNRDYVCRATNRSRNNLCLHPQVVGIICLRMPSPGQIVDCHHRGAGEERRENRAGQVYEVCAVSPQSPRQRHPQPAARCPQHLRRYASRQGAAQFRLRDLPVEVGQYLRPLLQLGQRQQQIHDVLLHADANRRR